jgi:ATP phosphoribosyltransferase regulatory subunit
MREPIQIGAELYGHAGLEADVEVVRLMVDSLKAAGIGAIHIDLGHPGVYRVLAQGLKRSPDEAEALFHAVQQKDAVSAGELGFLTTLNGGIEVIARARKELPRAPAITAALDDLERLAAQCAAPGVDISVDLAELGGFNYESGLVFAAFTAGSPDAIARGGRYDEVGASFGRARPATGFTMDLRQLGGLAKGGEKPGGILAPCADDPGLREAIDALRAAGEVVVVELPGHGPNDTGCDRSLAKKDGQWRVT